MATARKSAFPPFVVEMLRLCVVVFLAVIGYQIGQGFSERTVGPFVPTTFGVLLGGTTGYVLGGVVARLTSRVVANTERILSAQSAEQLLAALVGAASGVIAAATVTWPILLIGPWLITGPIFLFIVVTVASLGYRMGFKRRHGVLNILGNNGQLQPSANPHPTSCIVDTSAVIDGRMIDVAKSGFGPTILLVPHPVLAELQALADSADPEKRTKGRRGLDALESLRQERILDVEVIEDEASDIAEVDSKLVAMCLGRGEALLTVDSNLARVARVAGCKVLNLHALSLAMRPPVVVGEVITVHLSREGREPKQAIGHLDDGTMVVVDRAAARIGKDTQVQVTSVVNTINGRMIFAKISAGRKAAVTSGVVPDPRGAKIAASIAAASQLPTDRKS